MQNRRRPCTGCGGPKEPGKGRAYCEACLKETSCGHPGPALAHRLCFTCYHQQYRITNAEAAKEYRRQNAERDRAKIRAWEEANAERLKAAAATWRENNRDRINARQRDLSNTVQRRASRAVWLQANEGALREYHAARYLETRDRRAEQAREWRQSNPDAVQVLRNRRRSRLNGGSFTTGEWRELLEEFDNRCAYCNVPLTHPVIEHMTPLAKGGRHVKDNIVPSCSNCNQRKHAKTALQFLGMSTLST